MANDDKVPGIQVTFLCVQIPDNPSRFVRRGNLSMQLIQLITVGALLAGPVSAYVVNIPGGASPEMVGRANGLVGLPRLPAEGMGVQQLMDSQGRTPRCVESCPTRPPRAYIRRRLL
ncbi:hypothetical protein GQ53DRAFT_524444 [Thozetella sp. PMI_491]|nr:hypothetical protein GQ53DRAFT_524444 [Thozetella sp. PMI_491]